MISLDALDALASKATPGKRHVRLAYKNEPPPERSSMIAATAPGHQIWAEHDGGTFPSADMDFIAACDRETIRWLVRRLKAAEACAEALEYEIREGGTDHNHDVDEAGCDACEALARWREARAGETQT